MPVNWGEFTGVLVRAKKATYAGGATPVILDDGSYNLEYREGLYVYHDKYFGNDPFDGEETCLYDENPFWFMNYNGSTINWEYVSGKSQFSRDFLTEAIYTFLRDVLLLVPSEKPFRGPDMFENDLFVYTCTSEGTIKNFHGRERIVHKPIGEFVYRLDFNGGEIK